MQQRDGVHLQGGVGESGDAYEREADAVADEVVAGESAAPLLDKYRTAGSSSTAAVQKHEGTPAPQTTALAYGPLPPIDEPAADESRAGFIDNDDGANIRN